MENESGKRHEINVQAMFCRVFQNWRKILVIALIVAVLVGAVRFLIGAMDMWDPQVLAENEEKYQISLGDYNATGERLRTQIRNLRDSREKQQEYNDNSVLMKIDPTEEWFGNFSLYVDSKYVIDPSLSYQTPDLTGRLIAAYYAYLTSGEFFTSILNRTSLVNEIRYLNEIYAVSYDSGAATIKVSVVGVTEADVRELLGYAKERIEEVAPTVVKTIGKHDRKILQESVYSTIDLALDEKQKENTQRVGEYTNEIGETSNELSDWERASAPKPNYGWRFIAKEALIAAVVSGIAAVFVLALLFAFLYAVSPAVKTDEDLNACGVAILGHVYQDLKKRAFWKADRWISKHLGHRPEGVSFDQSCVLTAQNLKVVLKEKTVGEGVFVSGLGTLAEKTVERMGDGFRLAGDVLSDPTTVNRLEGVESVLLMVGKGVTSRDSVDRELTILKACGKTAIGVVVVE